MSTVAGRRIVLGSTLVAVLGGLLAWHLIADGPNAATSGRVGTGRGVLSRVSDPFTIDEIAATPISPGVSVPLDLGFTNPYGVTMSLTALHVRIQKITAPNADDAHQCRVGDFTVKQEAPGSPELAVAPGMRSSFGSVGLPSSDWPSVGMLDRPVNQDGCKGASLTLAYSASGTTSP